MADALLQILGVDDGTSQAPPIQRDLGAAPAQHSDPLLRTLGISAPVPSLTSAPAPASGGGGILSDAVNWVKNDVSQIPQRAKNIAGGIVREAGGIGATLIAPYDMAKDAIDGKGLSLEANRQRRRDMDSYFQDNGFDADSIQFTGGRMIGGAAGTAGVGTLLAAPVRALGAAAPVIGRLTDIVAKGLETGGFNVDGAKGVAGVAARMGTGAATGAAATGVAEPDNVGSGALIGALLPPGAQVVGKTIKALNSAKNMVTTPAAVKVAQDLGDRFGVTADDLAAVTTGPQILKNYKPTVPQILQNPDASQLQRTLKTAGQTAIDDAQRVQQAQMRATLDDIAPIDNTVQDSAERAGTAIQNFARPARDEATKRVSAAFDSVDPFNESGMLLPLNRMQGAIDTYLGPGTFGTGSRARQAIDTATDIGTEVIPAPKPIPQSVKAPQTLEQAVRKQGGINPNDPVFSGEINDLRPRESGTTGLYSQNGRSAEDMAQTMFERGFIPDADPSTLIAALRNGGGRKIFANDVPEESMQAMMERSMGDAPTGDMVVSKPVPFQTVQNLRSSIGEAAEQASAKQQNKEAAALRQMVKDIDTRLDALASGRAEPGEFFDQQMVDQYREALKLHADKMKQFELGPQIGMFRKGADGQWSVQGAEIPGKFYNGNRSQVDDMQAFKRLVGNRDDLVNEMKSFALSQGYNSSTTGAGDLGIKFMRWMESRSGANRELFTESEQARIREVGKAVKRIIDTEDLGRVTRAPDTAQRLFSLGEQKLDNPLVDFVVDKAAHTPYVGAIGKSAFANWRQNANAKKQALMATMLADPAQFEDALRSVPGMFTFDPSGLMIRSGANRVLPLMLSQQP